MKRWLGINVLLGVVCALGLALSASADTLQMKDGRVIQGRFVGGTETKVRFEADGKAQLYPIDEILVITFTGEHRATTPAPAAAAARSTPAGYQTVTVPAGTHLLVRMIDGVDSSTNHVGDRFRASLESDLTVDDVVVAPKGTDIYGRLAEAQEAGHIAGKSQLKLELTDLLINQKLQPIMTGDYEVSGASRGANTAKKVGGGAAIGAIIGAIAGGGKGAAIGAGVGGAAGATVQVLTKGEQVRVPSETLLDFRLEQPFTVQVAAPRQ